jgi:hypothetical protein
MNRPERIVIGSQSTHCTCPSCHTTHRRITAAGADPEALIPTIGSIVVCGACGGVNEIAADGSLAVAPPDWPTRMGAFGSELIASIIERARAKQRAADHPDQAS